MFVVEFLKNYGVQKLQEDYGIRVKICGPLMTLNYSVASPKFHAITKECRGLILDEQFNIVSRSIDRFFNYGEEKQQQPIDFDSCQVYEKIDGSLIKIYFWNKKWNVSTRSIAFAETTNVGDSEKSFKDLVFLALGGISEEEFQHFCNLHMSTDTTYVFEVTSEENRVVTKYEGYTLWYLAARKNNTGEYIKHPSFLENVQVIKLPSTFQFKSIEDCIEAAKKFKNYEEGFVVNNSTGVPTLKIKNPTYVAIHNGIGIGNLTTKKMFEMYLTDQVDEYVRYYPEEKSRFTSMIESIEKYFEECKTICETLPENCSQKEFALLVKKYPWKWIAFEARKNKKNFLTAFVINNSKSVSGKVQFLIDHLPS